MNNDDRVVFFDIDGTLLDTSNFAETARKSAIGIMVDNGLPLDKDEAYGVLKTIIREKGSNYGKHFNVLTQVVLGHEDPMLVALGMTTYHNVKMALLRPFPETIDTLIYLKSQGYRLAVISNGITIKQWEKLIRLNINSFFDAVIDKLEVSIVVSSPTPVDMVEWVVRTIWRHAIDDKRMAFTSRIVSSAKNRATINQFLHDELMDNRCWHATEVDIEDVLIESEVLDECAGSIA